MGGCGQRPDIGDFGQRVGRRFEEEQLRFRPDRRRPRRRVGLRHESRRNAGARHDVRKQLHGGAEQPAGRDDMVAVLQVGEAGGHDRRHAAGRGDAILGAFQRGEALLEHGHGRVGEAGVDVAFLLAGETPGGLRRVLEDEAGREVERLGVLAELAALLAGTNRQGFRAVAWLLRVRPGHQSVPSASCRTSCCEASPSPSPSSSPDLPLPLRLPSTMSR